MTVESADATVEKVPELGGQVHAGPFDVLNAGRMALVQDPTGAMLAAWEPLENPGASRVNDPGCLTWNELATRDIKTATAFYSGLFGWEVEEIDTGGVPPTRLPATGGGRTAASPR